MEEKISVSILCAHSEYVAVLATELTTTLKALKNALNEQPTTPHITTSTQVERIAELQRLLTGEVELLNQRLTELLLPAVASSTFKERKVDPPPDSATALQQRTARETQFFHRTRALLQNSQATVAFANEAFHHTREVLRQTLELIQYVHASRERANEWKTQEGIPQPANPVLQEEHSPPESISSSEPSARNRTE